MRYIKPIDFFDSDLDDIFKPMMPSRDFMRTDLMKTDIKEIDSNIILEMEVPGYKKENISIDFEDGYLTITANKISQEENKSNKDKRYIRRERFTGSCSRKFYIGDINENDIKANFCDGILTLTFPKESKKVETKKQITIE